MYAIIDIETTGGHPSANAITEISVYISDGKNVINQFETLVNPEISIPPYIQAFTGISNEMVQDAPTFGDIAPKLKEILDGNIFVAHNVNFDYSFIKHQFELVGISFQSKKLCTVRLSRKIVPGYRSYSLGNICASLNIPLSNRHRAGGDAIATLQLFHYLLENDTENVIEESLKKGSKEQMLPPNLPKEDFEKLPKTSGVYYFIDSKGLALYVGKAKNIKSRISSHFSGSLKGSQKQNMFREVHGLSYVSTGNELMAMLLESHEIRRLWPDENRAQKRVQAVYGLFDYLDQNGKIRFGIDKVRREQRPLVTFGSRHAALAYMQSLIDEFSLCPKLCNHQTNPGECISVKNDICDGLCMAKENIIEYNKKAQLFFDQLTAEKKAFYIVGKGRNHKEQNVIIYEPGAYIGYAYVNIKVQIDFDILKEESTPLKINSVMESILAPIVNGEKSKGYKVYAQMKMAIS
ncbi:MAG: exonuclease domain-containing protein [Bacteroidia bacterium]